MKRFHQFFKLVGAVCMAAACTWTHAQASGAPVTLVVPYGPGGNADLAARALAFALQKHSDAPPLVVINKAGAGGIMGSQFVSSAPADGKTLLLARVGSGVVAPALDSATTYKWDNFTFLGLLETDPYACVVAKDSPYKTFKDLLAAIKARPGKISYASSGNMDASVVFPKKFLLNMGMSPDAALKVPYKSGPETLTAVIGGQVDFACNGLSPYMASITGGRTRALIVSTMERVPQLPDVPTAEEVGMKNLEMVSGWSALFGPPGLPQEVVAKWSDYLQRVSKDVKWVEQVKSRGALPSVLGPEQTRHFVATQFHEYSALRPYMKAE